MFVSVVMKRQCTDKCDKTQKRLCEIKFAEPFSAEAGGFEPPVRLPVRQFSKLVVSATHPNFQTSFSKAMQRYGLFFIYANILTTFFFYNFASAL